MQCERDIGRRPVREVSRLLIERPDTRLFESVLHCSGSDAYLEPDPLVVGDLRGPPRFDGLSSAWRNQPEVENGRARPLSSRAACA